MLHDRSRYARSIALDERARAVIPGGHHLSGRPLTGATSSPLYIQHARGCHVVDVDGHGYTDYLMAFGPYLLGYAHPDVDAAAHGSSHSGRLVSLNHPLHVEFVEALLACGYFPGAEMGAFFRTGSEATTAALRIARRATGRRKVVRCGYHGWHDWCLPREDFVPAGLDSQVLELDANNPESLTPILQENPDVAAVIVAPEMVLPFRPEKLHRIREITRGAGAIFIMDEVKTGLRIAPGSICARIDLVPDIITVSKALGNGWPVAAILGSRAALRYGDDMHYSATFHGDIGAIASAMKTLKLVEQTGAAAHVEAMGARLIGGLNQALVRNRLPGEAYGEPLPAMPFMRFRHPDASVNAALTREFCERALRRGELLHPRHMWFPSLAHDAATIERTIAVADEVMSELARGPIQEATAVCVGSESSAGSE